LIDDFCYFSPRAWLEEASLGKGRKRGWGDFLGPHAESPLFAWTKNEIGKKQALRTIIWVIYLRFETFHQDYLASFASASFAKLFPT
jgi:hypothetical protein